jgi:hypothetical protein
MRNKQLLQEWVEKSASADYKNAQRLRLTTKNRWEEGIDHHPISERLMKFLCDHDFIDYDDYFCWKIGGDGDNGETLMYQMDAFFELLEYEKAINTARS